MMENQSATPATTTARLKHSLGNIPMGLKKFVLRAAIIFIAWRLLYELLLKPAGVPDQQLVDIVVWGTHKLLQPFYSVLTVENCQVFINNKLAITVAKPCNGLELMVMYVGFLLCLPTTFKRMVSFALIGIAATIVLNMVRCAALASMFYHHHQLADFMHHYLFKLMIYAVNFYLWILYSKKHGFFNS